MPNKPRWVATGNGCFIQADIATLQSALTTVLAGLERTVTMNPQEQTVEGLRADATRLSRFIRKALFTVDIIMENDDVQRAKEMQEMRQ